MQGPSEKVLDYKHSINTPTMLQVSIENRVFILKQRIEFFILQSVNMNYYISKNLNLFCVLHAGIYREIYNYFEERNLLQQNMQIGQYAELLSLVAWKHKSIVVACQIPFAQVAYEFRGLKKLLRIPSLRNVCKTESYLPQVSIVDFPLTRVLLIDLGQMDRI